MTPAACLVVNVSSVSGRSKNIGSQSGHIYWASLPALFWFSSLCPLLALAIVEVDFLLTNMP